MNWKLKGGIGFALVLLASYIVFSSQQSNLRLNGHVLSKADVNEGLNEVEGMLTRVSSGDLQSLRNLPEPKTDLARRFRRYFLETVELEDQYRRDSTFNITDCLEVDKHGGVKYLQHCLEGIARYKSAELKYFAGFSNQVDSFSQFCTEVTGKQPELKEKYNLQTEELKNLVISVCKCSEDFLVFAKRHPGRIGSDPTPLIVGKEDIELLKSLYSRLASAVNRYAERSSEIMTERQRGRSELLSGLRK